MANPTFKIHFIKKDRKLDSPHKIRKAETLASSLAIEVASSLTFACPITGLLIPNSLPAFPGLVLEAYHPLVHNSLTILKMPEVYKDWQELDLAALVLGSLSACNMLSFAPFENSSQPDHALVVVRAMATQLSKGQLFTFLEFLLSTILPSSKGFPAIELHRGRTTEGYLSSYINKCVEIENHSGWAESTSISSGAVKAPKFLSSAGQGKALNNSCYEAWLEVAPFLPATTKEKAKPFIKELATIHNGLIVERLVNAVLERTGYDASLADLSEGAVAAYFFKEAVATARQKAYSLGLHFSAADLDLPSSPIVETAPVAQPKNSRLAALLAKKGSIPNDL